MTRPVFGVTDSPREAARKKKAAERESRLRRHERPGFSPVIERDGNGMPVRLWFRRVSVPRVVCPDGGGRCSSKCELIDDCPGPVPNPARGEPTP